MICEMHTLLLFSFLAFLLVQSSAAFKSGVDTVKVPGVMNGWSIGFLYKGKDIRRVTFSIEDSIGKSLHLELRHNDKCTDNPSPQLLFNTKTNGQFDSEVTKQLTELTITQWRVEARDDHWLIKKLNCDGIAESCPHATYIYEEYEAFTFDYRSPHTLSDVKQIRIYGTTCDEGTFSGTLKSIELMVPPSFSQITIRGRRDKIRPLVCVIFQEEKNFIGYSLRNNYFIKFLPYGGFKKLRKSITTETFDEVIFQNIGGNKYTMTITVEDQEPYEYVVDLSSYDVDENWVLYMQRYLEITKFEIQY